VLSIARNNRWLRASLKSARASLKSARASLKSAREAYTSAWNHRDALEGCLKDLAAASIEDAAYIDELETDMLDLTNQLRGVECKHLNMQLQLSVLLDKAGECLEEYRAWD
jgi:hypothetical protein